MQNLVNAYRWLNHFDDSRLSSEITGKLMQIKQTTQSGEFERASDLILDLKSHADKNENGWERAETNVAIAILAFRAGKHSWARRFLEDAASHYSKHKHHYAVTQWMLGTVYWHTPNCMGFALYAWQRGMYGFRDLAYDFSTPHQGWYQKRYYQVRFALYRSRMKGRYIPVRSLEKNEYPRQLKRYKKRQRPIFPPRGPTRELNGILWKTLRTNTLPVYSRVPAGGWGAVDPDEVGRVEIDTFIIDGVKHRIANLRDGGQITLQKENNYAVVGVSGNSMNLAGIDDGDYVLVQVPAQIPLHPTHMDIVLAEREDIDTEATLKRYYHQGNTIKLHPHSDALDPETGQPYEALEIPSLDKFHIRGLAIAVLKRQR